MPEQVQVRITGQAMTARYGTLSTGDILRTDAAFAKHLVEECFAAEYIDAAAAVDDPMVVKLVRKKSVTAKPVTVKSQAPTPQEPEVESANEASAIQPALAASEDA